MIKWILFLPIRVLGLIFEFIGNIIESVSQRKLEKERQAAHLAAEQQRQAKLAQLEQEKAERKYLQEEKQRLAAQERAEKQKKQATAKQEKARAERFKKEQAEKDYYHYSEQLRETLQVYNELQAQFEQAQDEKKTTIYKKLIGLNQSIRNIEKQMEKAKFIMDRPEWKAPAYYFEFILIYSCSLFI